MFKILFLILVVMSSAVFAQQTENKEQKEKQNAYKFFEYEKVSDAFLREKIELLCNEVDKTSWIGWIINYGIMDEISNREKQILETSLCRKEFPSPRILFVQIEDKNKSKTEFWIVPPGDEPPTP